MGIVKGQCSEQVRIREIGMEQTAQLALCVPLVEPLLDFGGWFAPLSPPLCLGVYWIDRHLQIFPAMVFLLSVSSLHICFLSQMVAVLILFTSQPYGRMTHPVGKSYASIVDDEKTAFEQRSKHRQNGHKNPATSIVAAFADMGG
jgi:hypothetical protein